MRVKLAGAAGLLLFARMIASGQSAAKVDFNRQVHPILAAKCVMCHGEARRDGGLSLSTYTNTLDGGRSGASINPGDSKASLLVRRITGETQPRMPLGGAPLSDAEIATVRAWIDEGARSTPTSEPAKPKWEAPLSLKRPELPPVAWKNWTGSIDRATGAYLKAQNVNEPQLVSDSQFARRAYLDIWGLLPDPETLRAFVGDPAPNKREKLVERLLSDDAKYADHWISFWNDLLRNEEGVSYHSETASRKSITDWLYGALKTNLPYNRFVSQLLNPVAPSDPDGFLIGVNWRGTVSASQSPAMQAAQNTAQIFLGINLKCNACHDSFISKWKLKQAYAMASYFSTEPKLQLYRCDIAQQEFAQPGFLYPELSRNPPSDSLQDRRATAAAIFTDPGNGRLPRTLVNRVWQRLMGHGIVADPDEMDGEPWSAALLDSVAADFVDHGYDIKRLIGSIVSSRTYQMPSVPRSETSDAPRAYAFRGPEIRRITAEQFADAIGSITGDWHTYLPSPAGRAAVAAKPSVPATNVAGASSSPTRNLSGAAHGGIGDPGTPGVAAARAKAMATGAPDPAPAPTAPKPATAPETRGPRPSVFTREWRVAASPLTRALGRPIRDQVYSIRETQGTTLQALELVNGETLTHWLGRGARKMLGELPPEPVSAFDAAISTRTRSLDVDVDISGAKKLWLLVQDTGSYSPEKVEAVWSRMELVGPSGAKPLSSMKAVDDAGLRGATNGADIRVKTPSRVVYELTGDGYTRLRGSVGIENKVVTSDINPQIRFYLFVDEPNMERLNPVAPGTPLPAGPILSSASEAVERVFWYALGRAPSAEEKAVAEASLQDSSRAGRVSAKGLADLLWAVLMKPEFQLIY